MNTEPVVNFDEFLRILSSEVESLPIRDLELCDLSNEIGIVVAKLVGTAESFEREFKSGIEHGFDLVRQETKQQKK
ncbi:hypothetical protein QWY97_04065 [Vibrio cortegadensis]|uniref:hypothetical protein n=1 Tax=Vibrio cortegadensis TaxID=1328770 RepID=UPI0021C2C711|nr:hypothetical protein [Vibrio cortegadensis]MDN3696525.1 hypothetical protein [Vibrio cortegadensis]